MSVIGWHFVTRSFTSKQSGTPAMLITQPLSSTNHDFSPTDWMDDNLKMAVTLVPQLFDALSTNHDFGPAD